MAQEPRPTTNIADELSKLGNQVAEALRMAWESEDRRRLQAEVTEGLRRFGDQVEDTAKRVGEGDAARRVREQAEVVASKASQSEVVDEIREGLLNGLQALNRELTRLLNKGEGMTVEHQATAVTTETPAAPETPSENINPT